MAWQGVALLPFVDAKRLEDTLTDVYEMLTDEESNFLVFLDCSSFFKFCDILVNFIPASITVMFYLFLLILVLCNVY